MLKPRRTRLIRSRKVYCFLFFILFLDFGGNAENVHFYNGDTIKIYEQTFDTVVETLPAFEKPVGLANGHWHVLYINKKVKEDFFIVNGALDGQYIQYWPNGCIMYKGYFKNGIVQGKWNVYDNIGHLAKQYLYADGIKMKEKTYGNKKKLIQTVYYNPDGKSIRRIRYLRHKK